MTSVVRFNETALDLCNRNNYESYLLTTYLFFFLSLSLIMMSYLVSHYMELYNKLYKEVKIMSRNVDEIYYTINRDSISDDSSEEEEEEDFSDTENVSEKMNSILTFMANEIDRSKKFS